MEFKITSEFDGSIENEAPVHAHDAEAAAMLGALRWIKDAIENGMDAPRKVEFIRKAGYVRVWCEHDFHGVTARDVTTITAWEAPKVNEQRVADRIDGYDRDDIGESPDF